MKDQDGGVWSSSTYERGGTSCLFQTVWWNNQSPLTTSLGNGAATCEAFSSILICMDKGWTLLIFATSRKPICWKCGQVGHLVPSCPKKASGVQSSVNQNPPQTDVSSNKKPTTRNSFMKLLVTSVLGPTVPDTSLSNKGKEEWQVVIKRSGKVQIVELWSHKCVTAKGMNSSTSLNYGGQSKEEKAQDF